MHNEIVVYPNNLILVNAIYRSRIAYYNQDAGGIRMHIDPISSENHIEDDLDVMESIADHLFELYLKDPRIAGKLVRPRYWYSNTRKKWCFQFPFK